MDDTDRTRVLGQVDNVTYIDWRSDEARQRDDCRAAHPASRLPAAPTGPQPDPVYPLLPS